MPSSYWICCNHNSFILLSTFCNTYENNLPKFLDLSMHEIIQILKEEWCYYFHRKHHHLYPLEYGGFYVCDCQKCRSRTYVRR